MFLIEVSVHLGQGTGKPPVAYRMIAQDRSQMKKPGAAASRCEDFVKGLVSPRIFVAIATRGLVGPYRGMRQTVQGGDDLRLPLESTFLDRASKAQRLNAASNVGEIAKGIDRQWRDAEASLRFADDKPLRCEARQRLTYGARADRKATAQIVDLQLLSGREVAREQFGAKLRIGSVGEARG